jgi:mannose-1-phosphate guanylyltransferase
MRGFILAAGFGTRLRPITDHIPKALVSLCGKPLLERSLAFLAKEKIAPVGVNTHYMADKVAAYREQTPFDFALFHEQGAIRGTGGGLYFAREFLAADDAFFVCNVDIVYRFDTRPLIDRFLESGWAACLLAVRPGGRGTVFCDRQTGLYRGAPADGPQDSDAIPMEFIGAALYRRRFLDVLTESDFSIVPVWKRAMEQGIPVGVLDAGECCWRDIGTPGALAAIHFDFLDGRVDLSVPPEFLIDRERRRCFHCALPERSRRCIGTYAWVEPWILPEGCTISHSVVFADAVLRPSQNIENMIMTPYGEVKIGE